MPSGGLQAVFGRDVAHPPAVAWRVVHKRLVDRLTYEEICQELQPMSIGSVHNILVRFQAWMRASAPTSPPPLSERLFLVVGEEGRSEIGRLLLEEGGALSRGDSRLSSGI